MSGAPVAAPIISVDGVGKCYRLYAQPQDRLREALSRRRLYHREFWALRDVSFEVARGEAFGVIGRNGAGKSTLLQVLAGRLLPSTGRVQLRGRVSALLELGSGFNPEYSGRDNVFLYGSILGFSRAHVAARFDEIAAFADIGDHLDHPVKTYSSGMVVRLAFAVLTLLEPEILLADEWLSVGDVLFQSRCLKRIKRLLADGMTLVYVCHDPTTIQLLTRRCLWLENGGVRGLGPSVDVAQDYLHAMLGAEAPPDPEPEVGDEVRYSTTNELLITDVRFLDANDEERSTFRTGETLRIVMDWEARAAVEEAVFAISVFNQDGVYCLSAQSPPGAAGARLNGRGSVELEIALPLNHGEYRVSVAALDSRCVFYFDHHRPRYALTVRSDSATWGIFSVAQRWRVRPAAAAHAPAARVAG
jgi:lipopolysaccharide transport system ATP-binding protein